MAELDFEGRQVRVEPGDSIASALFRAGVRIFSRSFKYRRPRGLYCLTGDCPNCQLTVDGESGVRACVTPARPGQRVARPTGWPSADHDVGTLLWHARALMPVGFYYKTMLRPRALWPLAERVIRRLSGLGPVDRDRPPARRERLTHHPDCCVIGAGIAGLTAALAATDGGESVLLADEGAIGDKLAPGPARSRLLELREELARRPRVTLLERATAVGVYEGPLVPIAAEDFLHLVMPKRVVIATGGVERHPLFVGNDLPGVWMGRGAARMAGLHGLPPGREMVFWGASAESLEHLEVLRRAGVAVKGVILPAALAGRLDRAAGPVFPEGEVVEAHGRRGVRSVVVRAGSRDTTIPCDLLVVSLGLVPRDNLLRQAAPGLVTGTGDVLDPDPVSDAPVRGEGCFCPCEDVFAKDVTAAWNEGFQSTELLKRYTTATMGPCQGALCHRHLTRFVEAHTGPALASKATTARPPARPIRLEDLAAGARYPLEYRTALHDRHLRLGATMEWTGVWKRPERYGDVLEEYRAVRERASIMDVSTLGKYRIAGPQATEFLERLYPCHVGTIAPGRSRYALMLNEAGYVFDDGLICRLGPDDFYVTVTSGGADQAEGWFRDWAETWSLDVHIANLTATYSAINLAGPRGREVLASLTPQPVDNAAIPYNQHREVDILGVRCRVLRVGFVGELSFELHHPRLESEALWDALLEAGKPFGLIPHGLEALRLLRLEKGHIIVGQDTDFDSTPSKLGLEWAARMDKREFVGRSALERLARLERDRELVPYRFTGPGAPLDGAQVLSGGERVGYLTSSRFSPVLGHGIALALVKRSHGAVPATVLAHDGSGARFEGTRARGAFYDPEGTRLRA
jgi:sarcosine oxidase subunit alpha